MADSGHDKHDGHGGHDKHDGHGGHDQHDGHGSHDKHAGHDPDAFRRQFWIVLLLTIPVVLWSHEVQMWLGYAAPAFPGSEWIPAILGTIVFLYGGRVFLVGALVELGDRQPGMMTLISLAIVVAFVTSWAATIGIFEVEDDRIGKVDGIGVEVERHVLCEHRSKPDADVCGSVASDSRRSQRCRC